MIRVDRVKRQFGSRVLFEDLSGDGRPEAARPTPAHALTPHERQRLLQVANEPRFADMPPARITVSAAVVRSIAAVAGPASNWRRTKGSNSHRLDSATRFAPPSSGAGAIGTWNR